MSRTGSGSRVRALLLLALVASSWPAAGSPAARTTGLHRLRMMVPNSPGGGYDLTARTAVKIMEDEGITGRVEVFNVIGAGGTVAMARLMNEARQRRPHDDDGPRCGRRRLHQRIHRTRLRGDRAGQDGRGAGRHSRSRGFAVQTIDDFVAAWKADPASVTIGGGSSPGGPDHLFPMETARAVGRRPERGQLRLLRRRRRPADRAARQEDRGRHVGTRRVRRPDRGRPGPGTRGVGGRAGRGYRRADAHGGRHRPDLHQLARNPGAARAFPTAPRRTWSRCSKSCTTHRGWKEALVKNGWTDAFTTGPEFEQFLRDQDQRVSSTLTELGLT